MKKSRYSPEQVTSGLRRAEEGTPVAEVGRKMGISEQTFYRWKKKFQGMGVAEVGWLRVLEEESRKLKQLVATSAWASICCRTCCEKSPEACSAAAPRRPHAGRLQHERTPGLRGAYAAPGQPPVSERGRWAGCLKDANQGPGPGELRLPASPRPPASGGLVGEPQTGLTALLAGDLMLRSKKPKRHVSYQRRRERPVATGVDESWSMDFMSDELYDGHRIRLLTIVDNFTRESLPIKVAASIWGEGGWRPAGADGAAPAAQDPPGGQRPGVHVQVSGAVGLRERGGAGLLPAREAHGHAFNEAFNGRFRQGCLNENWFLSLEDAEEKVESWRRHYNGERPHSALGNLSPKEFTALASIAD